MKNFPSTLIRQQNTKQGLGSNLGDTLQNIGTQALGNILNGGTQNLTVNGINSKFENGYERFDLEHEISNYNFLQNSNIVLEGGNSGDNEIIKSIKNQNSFVSLKNNVENGQIYNGNKVSFEDPFLFSSNIFSVINNYKYMFKSAIPSIVEGLSFVENAENSKTPYSYAMVIMNSIASPSLFNPLNAVNITGIVENVPLINRELSYEGISAETSNLGLDIEKQDENNEIKLKGTIDSNISPNDDISDCSIKKLVELSKFNNNESSSRKGLGLAIYRYVDFMFCKELGKISNNHLITLRRFPGPIGDNIFVDAHPLYVQNDNEQGSKFKSYPELGHLVTWFGTEDNKLENICKYNYHATWKEFTASIQQEESQQKDEGWFDKIANSFSPNNNLLISKGFSGHTGLLGWGAQKLKIPILKESAANSQYYNSTLLSNYDQHRIYEPQNRIWSTHKYEGKLEFNQDITLTFKYVLRSYANINPKSAFLDLLGNIQVVTYRRGSFWGGETKIYGPQGNNNIYKRGNAFIDKAFDKLGGIWTMITNGTFDINQIQGWLSNILEGAGKIISNAVDTSSGLMKQATGNENEQTPNEKNAAKEFKENAKNNLRKIENLNAQYHWTDAIKGMFKNQLGRPALYAFNSLLSGEEVGPWHLTIGNPRNPIMSIGNLILMDSSIEHSGPLGLDDFPTELKLTVTLKHGRPRDSVEIQKMYTKGNAAIYRPMNLVEIQKYAYNKNAFGDISSFVEKAPLGIDKDTKLDKSMLKKLLSSI